MRKFKFAALCFALVASVSLLCACGNKKGKDDDDTKSERSAKKIKGSNSGDEVALPSKTAVADMEDFSEVMDYLETNAPSFFPTFNRLMQPIASALESGEAPTEADARKLESFVNSNEDYFEAIGALIGHENSGNIPESEQSRVEAFAERYENGLTNVGILIGIGLMSEDQ